MTQSSLCMLIKFIDIPAKRLSSFFCLNTYILMAGPRGVW